FSAVLRLSRVHFDSSVEIRKPPPLGRGLCDLSAWLQGALAPACTIASRPIRPEISNSARADDFMTGRSLPARPPLRVEFDARDGPTHPGPEALDGSRLRDRRRWRR